jgi:hypothetical protein
MGTTLENVRMDALAYEAPWLVEKLIKDHAVDSAEEAQALFTEVKRYIVLVRSDKRKSWKMYSLRIDEVWHQFVLFTWEYINFCERFFGGYIHHNPSNSPEPEPVSSAGDSTIAETPSSFEGFRQDYEHFFGEQLPELWYDEKSIKINRRVLNDFAGKLAIKETNGMLSLVNAAGDILVALNEFARDALVFIARTGAFYVRELPGDLTDEERVSLIATLVECKFLRVAA